MRLTEPSEALRQACQALGLCEWLAEGFASDAVAEEIAA
jgi:hypothetical protein